MLRYPSGSSMSGLVACPFCRELWEAGEARVCPSCGLALAPLAKLPPSSAAALDDEEPIPPHMETLPWTFLGRGRALLVALAVTGLALFFAPWAYESAPELRMLSGFGFARLLPWMWAPAVAWFVMIPLVVTRRSVHRMRGARVAAAFLAGIVLTAVAVRLAFPPVSTPLRPARVEWAWGVYASGLVALAAIAVAARFGGRVDDLPTMRPRPSGEVLH
jgi:hypothetical protein